MKEFYLNDQPNKKNIFNNIEHNSPVLLRFLIHHKENLGLFLNFNTVNLRFRRQKSQGAWDVVFSDAVKIRCAFNLVKSWLMYNGVLKPA